MTTLELRSDVLRSGQAVVPDFLPHSPSLNGC